MLKRASGILLPVSSLPGPWGIGTLGKEARQFVDFLAAAGQTYWQILPVGPTGYGDSPYQSFSAFAANPYFIDPDTLIARGLLTEEETGADRGENPARVDYGALYAHRHALLQKAADRLPAGDAGFTHWKEKQSDWLEDYSLFMALKEENDQQSWTCWPDEVRLRRPDALERARKRLAGRVDYWRKIQYLFYCQWAALLEYAHGKGVQIIGDIPIYVSPDSSDIWAAPELFQTDGDRRLTRVAGCPPDAFAADGQLWGNPLYDWPRHKATGYAWWRRRLRHALTIYDVVRIDHFRGFESYYSIPAHPLYDWPRHKATGYAWWRRRLRHALTIYDVVRIDHFRGFESYYSIPARDTTAQNGSWQPGPGMDFIGAIHAEMPGAQIIAEDLGYLTPQVKELLDAGRQRLPGDEGASICLRPAGSRGLSAPQLSAQLGGLHRHPRQHNHRRLGNRRPPGGCGPRPRLSARRGRAAGRGLYPGCNGQRERHRHHPHAGLAGTGRRGPDERAQPPLGQLAVEAGTRRTDPGPCSAHRGSH